MIQFSFGGNNLPQYTIEIYVGNAFDRTIDHYANGDRGVGNAIRAIM